MNAWNHSENIIADIRDTRLHDPVGIFVLGEAHGSVKGEFDGSPASLLNLSSPFFRHFGDIHLGWAPGRNLQFNGLCRTDRDRREKGKSANQENNDKKGY
jgi:hypothetical protein